MTDDEIIELADICCSDVPYCAMCPLDADTVSADECMGKLLRMCLDIINRQKEMIRALINAQETLQKEIERLKMHINNVLGKETHF